MRIPSHQKIDAQAQAYNDSHIVVMPDEWQAEYDALHAKYYPLRKQWDKIENACPGAHGGVCTCHDDPLYQTLCVEQIYPLVKKINMLCSEQNTLQHAVYTNYRNMLIKAKEAKLRRKNDLQRTENNSESSTHSGST